MKKILLATACVFGLAGMVSASSKPIVLSDDVVQVNDTDLYISRTIDPVSQDVCTHTISYYGSKASLHTDCINFFAMDNVQQGNVETLLVNTGNPWRPVKPEGFTDRAGEAVGGFADRAGEAWNNLRGNGDGN